MSWEAILLLFVSFLVCAELYSVRKFTERLIDEVEELRKMQRSTNKWLYGILHELRKERNDDNDDLDDFCEKYLNDE